MGPRLKLRSIMTSAPGTKPRLATGSAKSLPPLSPFTVALPPAVSSASGTELGDRSARGMPTVPSLWWSRSGSTSVGNLRTARIAPSEPGSRAPRAWPQSGD